MIKDKNLLMNHFTTSHKLEHKLSEAYLKEALPAINKEHAGHAD